MPTRFCRLLIAFALVLAVPAQAVAAAGADLCMAFGHHGEGMQAAHDQDAGAGHHHDEGGKGADGSHDAHCPPCASCCATAAAVATFPSFVLPEQAARWIPAARPVSFSGVSPETLDRPPLAL